eukprot:TRINITY_DN400_c0_g1_i5.p1 TRINITY_DN400_c0_g1~~TRINITY_DN400_c0_g1_i5.p1  ORF type:complete len:169 (+),score=69.71 TRINITY_DN400_c0_g1_i5:69-509(+)
MTTDDSKPVPTTEDSDEELVCNDDSKLKEITEEELSKHNSHEAPWLAIGGRVYKIKKYMSQHPGGAEVLLEKAGSDATEEFKQIGHGSNARELMKKYCIGKLQGATLMSDEDLTNKSGGEGSKWLIFAILAVIMAYIYMNKYKKVA